MIPCGRLPREVFEACLTDPGEDLGHTKETIALSPLSSLTLFVSCLFGSAYLSITVPNSVGGLSAHTFRHCGKKKKKAMEVLLSESETFFVVVAALFISPCVIVSIQFVQNLLGDLFISHCSIPFKL